MRHFKEKAHPSSGPVLLKQILIEVPNLPFPPEAPDQVRTLSGDSLQLYRFLLALLLKGLGHSMLLLTRLRLVLKFFPKFLYWKNR